MSAYTSAEIQAVLGIRPATLRKWVERGHIRRVGRDLYDGDSVIERCRQVADSPDTRRWLQESWKPCHTSGTRRIPSSRWASRSCVHDSSPKAVRHP